jgi:hypothetical protein
MKLSTKIITAGLVGDWLTTHICSMDTKLRQCPPAQSRQQSTTLAGRR